MLTWLLNSKLTAWCDMVRRFSFIPQRKLICLEL